MRFLLLLVALTSCTPAAAIAQTPARPSIAGCGTVAIPRADRTQPARLEATAACFERAAEIATAAAAERRALLVPPPVPIPAPPPPSPEPILVPSANWTRCAVEGGTCRFVGWAQIRYGAGDRWTTRAAEGSIACTNAVFSDPAVNVVKACDVRAVPIEPAPTPDVPPVSPPGPPPPVSALDPTQLLAEWQPRFAAIGFRLEIGPREPLPSIARPHEHRWAVALWQGEEAQLPHAYYAVFAPAEGSAEALADATSLVEHYYEQASHIAAGRLP